MFAEQHSVHTNHLSQSADRALSRYICNAWMRLSISSSSLLGSGALSSPASTLLATEAGRSLRPGEAMAASPLGCLACRSCDARSCARAEAVDSELATRCIELPPPTPDCLCGMRLEREATVLGCDATVLLVIADCWLSRLARNSAVRDRDWSPLCRARSSELVTGVRRR
jgi:hypothetical protein